MDCKCLARPLPAGVSAHRPPKAKQQKQAFRKRVAPALFHDYRATSQSSVRRIREARIDVDHSRAPPRMLDEPSTVFDDLKLQRDGRQITVSQRSTPGTSGIPPCSTARGTAAQPTSGGRRSTAAPRCKAGPRWFPDANARECTCKADTRQAGHRIVPGLVQCVLDVQ